MNVEKRAYPRVKMSLPLHVDRGISAETSDFSEGGVSFNTGHLIAQPVINLHIRLPEEGVTLVSSARLIWGKGVEGGSYAYGVEFLNIAEGQRDIARQRLIKEQISGLLNEINDAKAKSEVAEFFLKDVLNYSNELIKFAAYESNAEHYSLTEEHKLEQLNTQMLLKGYCLEELLGDEGIMSKAKGHFRALAGVWFYKSELVKRGCQKPKACPCDYRLLEYIYENKPVSRDIGVYFDNIFLKSPYAVALRARKDRFRHLLEEFINHADFDKVHLLSLSCGPSREIRELLPKLQTPSSVIFSCLDWDEDALRFSQDSLLPMRPHNVDYRFIKEDILAIMKEGKKLPLFSKYNLIYSVGLMDYLPDDVFKKLLSGLYELLQPGGKIIFSHKNREKTFAALLPNWLCDWKSVPRTIEEVNKLLHDSGLGKFLLSTDSDEFGFMFYFTLTKV